MTDHEIENLQSGPELDRLVAEACGIEYERKLNPSGLHDWEEVGGNMYGNTYQCSKCGEYGSDSGYGAWPPDKEGCNPTPVLFRPSTDWNDAMRAIVKFFGSTQVNVAHTGTGIGRDCWYVWVDSFDEIKTDASTGPLAICRAILKAKQEDTEA